MLSSYPITIVTNSFNLVADYLFLITLITIIFFFLTTTLRKVYNYNQYINILIGLVVLYIIKELQLANYTAIEDFTLIKIVQFLSILLFFYTIILNKTYSKEQIFKEYPSLMLLAFFGMLLTLEITEFLSLFLSLELQAFSFYTIIASRNTLFSIEGALKYFLIGALASATIIFGISFIYELCGTTSLADIAELSPLNSNLFAIGGALLVIGFCLK